jgi:hypothetical protein
VLAMWEDGGEGAGDGEQERDPVVEVVAVRQEALHDG